MNTLLVKDNNIVVKIKRGNCMTFITQTQGYLFLVIFGLLMFIITYFFAKNKKRITKQRFLLANRTVGWFLGGSSIAASWIWAPALFISVQVAYENGLAGLFWFTVPNIIALIIYIFLAPQIRRVFPKGYTLPQYIFHRLRSKKVHKLFLMVHVFYQIMAITVQLFAGGSLITLLTGIPLLVVMPLMAIITLAYTLISGLKASIITDFVQLSLIFSIGSLIIFLVYRFAGGITVLVNGLSGIANVHIFNPGIAFSFGIVTAISLIAGSVSDQQYWQRSFAIKENKLIPSFLFGVLLFAIVPLGLSLLGFFAAAKNLILPKGIDVSMIGVQLVANLLPKWALVLFVVMLLAGLSSTLDSGLSAGSSLFITDIISKKMNPRKTIFLARLSMFGLIVVGLLFALLIIYIPQFGLQQLWWIFNTIAAGVLVPTILSLFWKRLSAKGVFWGIIISFIVGLPIFIYGNIIGNSLLIVSSLLFIIIINLLFCLMFRNSSDKKINLSLN